MSYTRNLIHIAIFIALGLTLPMVFHLVGGAGPVFLPMHIPVFMAGLLLGIRGGLTTGALTPVVSSIMTGMPPLLPMLPVMAAELGVYGALAGYLYKERKLPLIGALVAAMIAGRMAALSVVACLAGLFGLTMNPMTYITGVITTGIPGVAIQLVFVPLLVKKLEAAGTVRRNAHDS
ncbi:ECF transporter S component [Sporomusa aerivorans]|uniref:ECF transporter S component n=1 Tax=Sporomusa aerivorans TaxID=204936 RepID=UPI00352AEB65